MTGVGSYLPKNKYSNEDLSKFVNTSDDWITKRSGIKFRHYISKHETTSDMAANAAINALKNAQIKKEDTIFAKRPEQLSVADFIYLTNLVSNENI